MLTRLGRPRAQSGSECAMRCGYPRPPFLTIGVWCIWLHFATCKLSIRLLVSAFLFAFDSCLFLQISVRSWCLLSIRFGSRDGENMLPKCFKHDAKIYTNSFKTQPKSTKMVPRSAPKATLGATRFQNTFVLHHLMLFGRLLDTTWVILGTILRPAGRQGASTIDRFGIRSH